MEKRVFAGEVVDGWKEEFLPNSGHMWMAKVDMSEAGFSEKPVIVVTAIDSFVRLCVHDADKDSFTVLADEPAIMRSESKRPKLPVVNWIAVEK